VGAEVEAFGVVRRLFFAVAPAFLKMIHDDKGGLRKTLRLLRMRGHRVPVSSGIFGFFKKK
jgi:hypothetical protein